MKSLEEAKTSGITNIKRINKYNKLKKSILKYISKEFF